VDLMHAAPASSPHLFIYLYKPVRNWALHLPLSRDSLK
jgi:hypothetical protein